MGRKKTRTKSGLPPRVYVNRNSYRYVPEDGTSITLCSVDKSIDEVMIAYLHFKQKIEHEKNLQDPNKPTLFNLAQRWIKTDGLKNRRGGPLHQDSQKKIKRICAKESPIMQKFGSYHPDDITPVNLRHYFDSRYRLTTDGNIAFKDGAPIVAKNSANKEHTYLSQMYNWGIERGFCHKNPVTNVRMFPQNVRDRYITDQEFKAIWKNAKPYIQVMMELSFYACLRFQDVCDLTHDDVDWEQSILYCGNSKIQNRPGNIKDQTVARDLSKHLKNTVERAQGLPLPKNIVVSINQKRWLVHKNGEKITNSSYRKDWDKAREKAGLKFSITDERHLDFHDIKKKSITDKTCENAEERQLYSNHFTRGQSEAYNLGKNGSILPSNDHDLSLF